MVKSKLHWMDFRGMKWMQPLSRANWARRNRVRRFRIHLQPRLLHPLCLHHQTERITPMRMFLSPLLEDLITIPIRGSTAFLITLYPTPRHPIQRIIHLVTHIMVRRDHRVHLDRLPQFLLRLRHPLAITVQDLILIVEEITAFHPTHCPEQQHLNQLTTPSLMTIEACPGEDPTATTVADPLHPPLRITILHRLVIITLHRLPHIMDRRHRIILLPQSYARTLITSAIHRNDQLSQRLILTQDLSVLMGVTTAACMDGAPAEVIIASTVTMRTLGLPTTFRKLLI
mmetsp:Transcript_25371/g.53276  ORF Transcript_25371/g.53276 Transcript_25371/m.53276 type:complete len:286 (-) Transcript_25371:1117-1974(-)